MTQAKTVLSTRQIVLFSWAGRLSSALAQIITIRLLIEFLGVDDYAVFVILYSFSSWIAILDFGFGSYFQNALSQHRAFERPAHELIGFARRIQIQLAVLNTIALLSLALVAIHLAPHRFFSGHDGLKVAIVVGVIFWSITTSAGISYKLLFSLHRGYLAYIYPALASFISLILLTLASYIPIQSHQNLSVAVACVSVPPAVIAVLASRHFKSTLTTRELLKSLLSFPHPFPPQAAKFFFFSLLVAIVTNLDYFIMSYTLQIRQIPEYNLVGRVFTFVYFFLLFLLTNALAEIL